MCIANYSSITRRNKVFADIFRFADMLIFDDME